MDTTSITTTLRRAKDALRRRPSAGVHADSSAVSRWRGDYRVTTRHPGGAEVASDMPAALGGSDAAVTPGWYFRAGIAACATTSLVIAAALEEIALSALEVRVDSTSDTCGLFGIADEAGRPVAATPRDVTVRVRIAATNADDATLRAFVTRALERSPIPCAVQAALPIAIDVTVDPAS